MNCTQSACENMCCGMSSFLSHVQSADACTTRLDKHRTYIASVTSTADLGCTIIAPNAAINMVLVPWVRLQYFASSHQPSFWFIPCPLMPELSTKTDNKINNLPST